MLMIEVVCNLARENIHKLCKRNIPFLGTCGHRESSLAGKTVTSTSGGKPNTNSTAFVVLCTVQKTNGEPRTAYT